MGLNRLSAVLMVAGLALALVAAMWWGHFYEPLAHDRNVSLTQAVRCLYTNHDTCGFVAGPASADTGLPYEPVLLWIGGITFAAGLVIRLALPALHR